MKERERPIHPSVSRQGRRMLSDGRIKRVGWARILWVIVDLMSKIFVYWIFEPFEDNAAARVAAGPCLPTRLIMQLSS